MKAIFGIAGIPYCILADWNIGITEETVPCPANSAGLSELINKLLEMC
jgi:hypothetical protein